MSHVAGPTKSGLFIDNSFTKHMFTQLDEQRRNCRFCDVILKVSSTEIYTHSNILVGASPYLCSVLSDDVEKSIVFSHKNPQVIEIHINNADMCDGYGEAVQKVVEFMYTSSILLSPTVINQVVEIANILQMEHLLKCCLRFQNGECPEKVGTSTNLPTELLDTRNENNESVDIIEYNLNISQENKLEAKSSIQNQCPNENKDPDSCSSNLALVESMNKHVESDCLNYNKNVSRSSIYDQSTTSSHANDLNDHEVSHIIHNGAEKDIPTTREVATSPIHVLSKLHEDLCKKTILNEETGIFDQMVVHTEMNQYENKTEQIRINFEELSDLVQFNDATTALLVENNSKSNNQIKESELSQESFGHRKGRKKRGRPRKKVVVNKRLHDDSDEEFEKLISESQKDETLDNVNKDIEDRSQNEEKCEISNENSVSDNTKTISSGLLASNKRKRNKPSQYLRDYIMTSVARRTRVEQRNKREERAINRLKERDGRYMKRSGVFVCSKCDFSTEFLKLYRLHLKTHPETNPCLYECGKCDFKTAKARLFKKHEETHLTKELRCCICNFQAGTEEEFREHSLKHNHEKSYFCLECNARFKTRTQLLAHRPTHQFERPFVCVICSAGFKWKHALKSHMITHSSTKDHLCDVCGFATAHKSQLKAHKLIHTGEMFKCDFPNCSFQSTKRQNLKYHKITHTNEKPHQCEICGQKFSLIRNMRRHMLLHTDSRPYSCKLCAFKTTRYDKLKEHTLKLHKVGAPSKNNQAIPNEGYDVMVNLDPNVTLITAEFNPDGSLIEESITKIAMLTSCVDGTTGTTGDGVIETIKLEQGSEVGSINPTITTVQIQQIKELLGNQK